MNPEKITQRLDWWAQKDLNPVNCNKLISYLHKPRKLVWPLENILKSQVIFRNVSLIYCFCYFLKTYIKQLRNCKAVYWTYRWFLSYPLIVGPSPVGSLTNMSNCAFGFLGIFFISSVSLNSGMRLWHFNWESLVSDIRSCGKKIDEYS